MPVHLKQYSSFAETLLVLQHIPIGILQNSKWPPGVQEAFFDDLPIVTEPDETRWLNQQ